MFRVCACPSCKSLNAEAVETPDFAAATAGEINPGTSGSPTGNIYTDGLIWGGSWTSELGTGVTLTWAPVTREDLGNPNETNGLAPTAAELAAFRLGLSLWADVADIVFEEQPLNTEGTDLSYMVVSNFTMLTLTFLPGVLGFHEVPDGSDPGPLTGVFNRGGAGFNNAGLQQGGFGFITVIHEIGHGLGLAHPHDGGGDGQVFPGVNNSGDPGNDDLNQGIWTTMSYVDGWETQYPSHTDRSYGWQAGPMALDIAAIQTIYGANMTTRTGDDVYSLPTVNGPGTFWLAIWDAGGLDTISAAGAAGAAVIDLREAPLVGPNAGGYVSWVQGIVGGRTIANGVTIEDAVGGSGNDTITGNDAANLLDGGAGADSMAAGLGDDTYVVDNAGDVVVEDADAGVDTILSSITLTLGANLENLTLTGAGAINGTGNTLDNLLVGNGGANRLVGAGGADTLDGGLGGDTLTGGAGADQFLFDVLPASLTAADRVADFTVGVDILALASAVFTALGAPGALAASAFRVGNAAADADDRIIYSSSTGWFGYDPDGNGLGQGFILANIGIGKAVTADSFLIV